MKKTCFCLVLAVLLSLTGCFRYHYIAAEIGSQWTTTDSLLSMVIVNEGLAEGTLQLKEEAIPIECYFGPGETDFIVYVQEEYSDDPTNGDAWLFRGNYLYNEKEGTITIDLYGDQIGLSTNQIILYEKVE